MSSMESYTRYFNERARQGWGPEVIAAMDERELVLWQTLESFGVSFICDLPPEVQEELNGKLQLNLAEVLGKEDV